LVKALYWECIDGYCYRKIAYLLAHWAYLSTGLNTLPSWGEVARFALESYFPQMVVMLLLIDIKRTHSLARQQGLDITVSSWPYG